VQPHSYDVTPNEILLGDITFNHGPDSQIEVGVPHNGSMKVKGYVSTSFGIKGDDGCPGVKLVCVPHMGDDGVDGYQLELFMTSRGHITTHHFEEVNGLDSMGDAAVLEAKYQLLRDGDIHLSRK
jgi:hypothetical protein